MSAELQTASMALAGRRDQDPSEGLDGLTAVALVVGAMAIAAAGATIWLVLTDPVTFTHSLESGEITPLVRRLADVLVRAVTLLLDYL